MKRLSREKAWDIQMEDLTIGYPGLVVLEGLNATLPAGKISVILGGSGSGKSTLMRHILGLSRPFSGRILLGHRDIFKLSTSEFRCMRRRIGVLFQDGALLGSLTLGENVALPLKEHTRLHPDTIREVVLLKLRLVGLEDFVDFHPAQLSGGMRKRAGLARALVMDPPILLCDEPTSGLDPINAALMDQLLKNMNRHFGVTVVTVSHDLQSLFTIADYALVLHQGQAAFAGALQELKGTDDPYLRQFLDRKPGESTIPELNGEQEAIGESLEECSW